MGLPVELRYIFYSSGVFGSRLRYGSMSEVQIQRELKIDNVEASQSTHEEKTKKRGIREALLSAVLILLYSFSREPFTPQGRADLRPSINRAEERIGKWKFG